MIKILDYFQQIVGRNKDVKVAARQNSKGSKQHGRENLYCVREYLTHSKQNVGRNKDIKSELRDAGEGSKVNEEHVIEPWRMGNPCYVVL